MLLETYIKMVLEESSSRRFFHGSSVEHKVGSTLIARSRPTEFSDRFSRDGVNVEEFVDNLRPDGFVSRLHCVFVVDDINALNLVGASEDYVYEVEPIGKITVANLGWFIKVVDQAFLAKIKNRPSVEENAKNYWLNAPNAPFDDVTEYLCESIKIIKQIS
jgi:hypothetical protein